ncbi:tryptophan aminotransferase-related protein 3-like [Bidens hawaiensis]|uniref:tryptophan aminotransferase-related protein 3-like n=1 Tax=Bidens hawaiensis TaxID=980011 RepID=UPI0040492C9D
MGKTKIHCYGFCLLMSMAMNILLIIICIYLYQGVGGWGERKHECGCRPLLSWSQKAAVEAEAVAAISCSGHGRAYVDGLVSEGQHVCECHRCYGGVDCSEFTQGCVANADSGDPLFLEPFWFQHATDSAVVISGWHRMSYYYSDGTKISNELDTYIRKIHSLAGNAVTEGRYLVFGIGSTQLFNAAIYALSSENSSSPSNVLATIPYYPVYMEQTVLFNSENYQFEGDTSSWQSNNTDVIEFVTSPNNPDGELKKAVLDRKAIYDHAYFWPHFTPIPGPSDHDLMLFTLSKLTGHAGARFGWAVIKDKDVYEKFLNYIELVDMGISKDTQLRVLKLLKVIVEGDGKPFFEFAYNKMRDRWDRMYSVLSKSTRFSVQDRHPLHCNFFNETRIPSPAYVWLKCEREGEDDCVAVLEAEKITGRRGSRFSSSDRYTRISLIITQDDFELLLQRFTELVSLENDGIGTMRQE